MGPTIVTTPKTLSFIDPDKRTLDEIGSIITQEMRTHKRWTASCTAIMQKNPRCLFLFDRYEHSIRHAYGSEADYKIALNPCMIHCYHPRCLQYKKNPIKLRTMFVMKEFLYHLEEHVDDVGVAMQKRFGAVHKNQFLNSEDLDNLAPAPSKINDKANNLSGDELAHLYKCIDSYGIERILLQYRDEDVEKLNDTHRDGVVPQNPHYLCHWSDMLISHKIITPSSLRYQENDAFIFSILQFPDPVRNWSVWGTVHMYALKMYTSVSGAGLNLLRGITCSRVTRRNRDLVDIYEFARGINHACPSVSSCQRNLPELKYENKTLHTSELIFHITCLEESKESFKFNFSSMVTRFPVTVVADEQEINQGTFTVNGELCGLMKKMNVADIREVGLKHLAKHIAENNNFIVAVRENILVDLKGICCSNAVTTFESGVLKSEECLDRLDEVTQFANSCLSCLTNGWKCEYSNLDEMCSKCAEFDIKCISLVVFHVLWDMGSGHKKAAKRSSNGLETTSTDEEMMSSKKYTIGFGGLHMAKAFVNCMRNHVLQHDGEYYGTDMLLALRNISEILQLIKNAVFVGKDHQSDLLAFLTVCPTVQRALKSQENCWVQRIPEKYLSYKKNAKSQKEIVFGVDVCVNRNGDVFLLDAGAACIHVINRCNVAAVDVIGKYNSPNLEVYSNDDKPKNIVKNLRLSHSLFDVCMDDNDNLYVTDGGRAEVIIVQKCLRAKSCKTNANFYIIDVPEILSSAVMANQLFVLKTEESEKVVQLLTYSLPKKCVKNFNLQYNVTMTVPCNIKRLISVPFNKYFGGQDDENSLKLFWYSKSRGVIKLEKPLNLNSCTKPFVSSDGYILTGTDSGIDVHHMYGKGLIEHTYTRNISGSINALSLNGRVITAVVTIQNTTCLLQNSPLDFGIEFSNAVCMLYNAIGYVPPRGNKEKPKLTLDESICEARVSVDLLTAMQQEVEDRSPKRSSFRGADGMPATGTIKCLQSTVHSWEVLKERLDRIEEGSSARVHTPAIANENNVEHFFGFVKKKGQGHSQNFQEYLIAKRRHLVDYKFKMANVPFCQHEKEKVRDKGYQDIEHGRFTITIDALKKVFAHSNKEDYAEVDIEISDEDDQLLKKAYLLAKSVPRQSNRAKWREKSGYQPNMLSESSSAGVLNKNDLVCSRSETDELFFFIVQEKFVLDDINRTVPVRKVGSLTDMMVSCKKLLGDKGQIFVVPSQLYTVDEGGVIFDDTVSKHMNPLMHAQAQVYSDEDWSVLLEEESGSSSDNRDNADKNKKGKRKIETENEHARVKRVADDILRGMLVTVLYEGQEFPGEVTEVVAKDSYRVKCMEKGGGIGSTWRWPRKSDEQTYARSEIVKKNITMKSLPGTDRVVEYNVPELDDEWGKPLTKTLEFQFQ